MPSVKSGRGQSVVNNIIIAMAARMGKVLLFVKNLPWTVSTAELQGYFEKFGVIQKCIVPFDKNTGFSKGFGLVTFKNEDSYNDVMKREHVLDGVQIFVQTENALPRKRYAQNEGK